MTHTVAVVTAAFIHMFLRMTIFLEPDRKSCSPQTPIASWFFLLSVLEILWDSQFIPERYKVLPEWCLGLVEVFISVFLIEFSIIVVWCNLEKLIYRSMMRFIMEDIPQLGHAGGEVVVELVTITLSMIILYYVSRGTDIFYQLKRRYGKASRKVKRRASNIFKSMSWIRQFKEVAQAIEEPAVDEEDGLLVTYCGTKLRRSNRLLNKSKKV